MANESQDLSQPLQALAQHKGPLSTAVILVALLRGSAGVPTNVPREKLVDPIAVEREAAKDILNGLNPKAEQNKQVQNAIYKAMGETSQALTLLESAGSKSAYDMKTELQEIFVPLRTEVNNCAKLREELLTSVGAFMVERNKLINKMMERFENNPAAETSTLVNELQRQQKLFVKRIETLNAKEELVAKKFTALADKAVRRTEEITNIKVEVAAQETPHLH